MGAVSRSSVSNPRPATPNAQSPALNNQSSAPKHQAAAIQLAALDDLAGPSVNWSCLGANPSHTCGVTCSLRIPPVTRWRVSAAQLGAPPNRPAHLHPRALVAGVLLVEMETPGRVALVAMDVESGRVRWQRSFPFPHDVPEAGLQPGVADGSVFLYLEQEPSSGNNEAGWSLSRLSLKDGHAEWERGTIGVWEAEQAPSSSQTLFRPVVLAGSVVVVTPDFFGGPPTAAFGMADGALEWRADRIGGDVPTIGDLGPGGPVLVGVDYAAGRVALRTVLLKDGSDGPAAVSDPLGTGTDWTEGDWDCQVRWVDGLSHRCGVSAGRMRASAAWPAVSCALPAIGEPAADRWGTPGFGSLSGPILNGSIYLGGSVDVNGKRVAAVWRVNIRTGHTIWATRGADGGRVLLAAPGVVVGRSLSGELELWSAERGAVLYRSKTPGLRDCIAGGGKMVASYEGPHPSGGTTFLAAYE